MLLRRLYWSAYLAYHLRGQARYPFEPPARILSDQARRVRATVTYAYRYVPYYRETMDRLGLRPMDFRGAEDLARLPLLDRAQMQRDPEYYVSTANPPARCVRLRSGGSTGVACAFYHDTASLFQNAAHGERERCLLTALAGKSLGYREAVIAPPISAAFGLRAFTRERALQPPSLRIERRHISMFETTPEVIRQLNEFQPDIIQTMGSYLETLFGYLHDTHTSFQRPKAVVYTSDGLSPAVRRLIEREFHIPVFSTYGATEALKIGFECQRHQGLHLNIDLYPVRIADAEGRTLPAGASGEVVISNLVNRGTVLLNYRQGDIASLLPEPCPCGRSLPRLSFLQGRSDDLIEIAPGRIVHPQAMASILGHEDQVWQYQVVQETGTHFRVAVVAAGDCDRELTRKHIAAGFASYLGDDVTVEVCFTASIDRSEAGKYRTVVSMRRLDR